MRSERDRNETNVKNFKIDQYDPPTVPIPSKMGSIMYNMLHCLCFSGSGLEFG